MGSWVKPKSFKFLNDSMTVESILQPGGSNQYLLIKPAISSEQRSVTIRIDRLGTGNGAIWFGVMGRHAYGFYQGAYTHGSKMTFSNGSYSSTGFGYHRMAPSAESGEDITLSIDENKIVTFETKHKKVEIKEFVNDTEELYFLFASTNVGNQVTLVD